MVTAACRLVLLALALLLGFSPAVAAGGKVALVIGNSSYRHAAALKNPVSDARAFAGLLERMGFASVSLQVDQDYGGMRRAIRDFAVAAEGAEIAIIYYAGHGMEIGGENYLVPVDARLERDQDLDYEAITLASVLKSVEGASRLRLVILDACRNNPLAAGMKVASGQTRSVAQGLTSIEPPGDVLVAFAARHGTTAADGEGEHSPFTAALLRHFDEPGTDVRLVLGEVRDSVLEETKNRQEPHIYGTLGGSAIYLVPAGTAAAGDSEALCRVELERARAKAAA